MATVFSLLINALCVKVQVAIGIYKAVYIHTYYSAKFILANV